MDHGADKLLLVVEEDDAEPAEQHPRCQHGPTVLFYRQSQLPNQGYFSCSAHRDSKLCSFHLPADQWKGPNSTELPSVKAYPENSRPRDPNVLEDPTKNLSALSQDKVNAQYFFDEAALDFLVEQCKILGIT